MTNKEENKIRSEAEVFKRDGYFVASFGHFVGCGSNARDALSELVAIIERDNDDRNDSSKT